MAFDICADLATLLTSITSNVYGDEMPETPDNLIVLYHSAGRDPQHTMGTQKAVWENPTIQIMVRHTTASTALTWIESIKNALDGVVNKTINGHYYMVVLQQGDVLPLGRDSNGRIMYSLNFACQVRR
jgi:hypothetical protein